MMIGKVYISHSRHDEDLAREISRALSRVGVESFVAMYRLSGGITLSERITFGIRHSDCLIALITMDGIVSSIVNQEIGFARALDQLVFPLLEVGAELPTLINHLKPISFSIGAYQDAIGQLIRNVRDLARLEWLKVRCPFCHEEMTQYLTSQEEVDRALLGGTCLETICSYCENTISLDPRTFSPVL